MSGSYVEEFYRGHKEMIEYLIENGQITHVTQANDNFRRSLVLAVASYFEHEISDVVRTLAKQHAGGNAYITALIEQKAVVRQYHSYFDWDKPNANKFFALFGVAYKDASIRKFADDPEFKTAVQSFMSLGGTRNRLVHQNYVQFDVDQTPEDIIKQFRAAQTFLKYVRDTLLITVPQLLVSVASTPDDASAISKAQPR